MSFGKATYRIVQSQIEKMGLNTRHLCGPPISKLYPTEENKEIRLEFFEKLKTVKAALETTEEKAQPLKLDDLPRITVDQALSLTLLDNKQKIHLTNDKGELIEISKEIDKESKADYKLTTGEIVITKLLRDIFKAREIKITKGE